MAPLSYGEKADTKPAEKIDLDFTWTTADKPAPMRQERVEPMWPRRRRHRPVAAPGRGQLARPAAALELDKSTLSFESGQGDVRGPDTIVLDGQWHERGDQARPRQAYQEMATSKARARSCRKCCTKATTSINPKRRPYGEARLIGEARFETAGFALRFVLRSALAERDEGTGIEG